LKSLTFCGSAVLRCDATEGESAVNASSIVLADASLIFHTAGSRLFGRSPSREGEVNLTILYGAVTSESGDGTQVLALNATFLGIGNATLPLGGAWTFCVSGAGSGSESWFVSDSVELKGLLTSVLGEGLYSVFAEHRSGVSGHLLPSDEDTHFNVSRDFSFFETAQFIPAESRTPTPSISPTPTRSASSDFAPSSLANGSLELETEGRNLTRSLPASPPLIETDGLSASTGVAVELVTPTPIEAVGLPMGAWIAILIAALAIIALLVGMMVYVIRRREDGQHSMTSWVED
jgi:hypothetical protein